MIPKLTLCADDFGYNHAICTGILKLAESRKINAISIMTNMPTWIDYAGELQKLSDIQLGLHFNLTSGQPLEVQTKLTTNHNFFDHHTIMRKAFLRQLDKKAIKSELRAQLNCFREHLGKLPDFIDGHQHIQQLPVIRDALTELYLEVFPEKKCYLRVSSNGWLASLSQAPRIKRLIITATGALSFKKKLLALQIPHNESFAGIYNFANAKSYPKFFSQFLAEANKTPALIMCHPGLASDDQTDAISAARYLEYQYFSAIKKPSV